MDISDTATVREEADRAIALGQRRPAGPQATGLCLNCDRPLPDGQRWCDAECRDEWHEWEQQQGQRP